ncbi:hypothetical protein FAUST_3109 [Fusarium austroamericanum]|uniref:Uncharacterized protein n=1 Tax=Fusarium austroamericanum TaxID=282268 RepID=A0AAN6HI02_FUSAU|nr:hypothetical protein FAUST_3109 [Fusarium austroamericanum]
MQYSTLVFALLAAVASAAPLEENPFPGAKEYTPGQHIDDSEVIVPVKDTAYVVKEDVYLAKLKAQGIKIGAPELDPKWVRRDINVNDLPERDEAAIAHDKRDDCSGTNYIVTDKTETFVDWDVQMSPVACAIGADMDISVSSGYTISNSVGGSAGTDLTFVADRLGASLGVNYSKTWTTLTSVVTKGTVKDGFCGTVITKPTTTRRSGRQFRGCIGSATEVGTWYADDRGHGSYNGITWIDGAISTCSKPGSNPPLSRCNGQGNFH